MTPNSNRLKDIVSFFKKELEGFYSKNELNAITVIIFESLFKIERQDMALYPDRLYNETQIVKIIKVIKRLKRYEPVQYIVGFTDFMELKVKVEPPVLIPRPETEELVLWVEDMVKPLLYDKMRILDIGTGSGCIALVLKRRMPEIFMTGLDINPKAIDIANKNAQQYNINVDFIEKDILKVTQDDPIFKDQWDVWVSNPPYVRVSEKKNMQTNVLKYEPKEALFVKDDKPLIFYETITDLALKALKHEGMLFFEINEAMGQDVRKLLLDKGFSDIVIKKDIHGKERFAMAVNK